MRSLHLSNKPWQNCSRILSRNLINLRKMSANSPPGKSDGDEPIDRSGSSVPPNPAENIGSRIRDLDVDSIRRYLAQKLGFYEHPEPAAVPVNKVLEEVTLDGIVKWIKSERCKNVITLAGAGISTSAGIPDFRSPETGLYHNLQKYDLPEPQAIFEINFFRQNPKPFFMLAKELYPGSFKPTASHYFIRLLQEKVRGACGTVAIAHIIRSAKLSNLTLASNWMGDCPSSLRASESTKPSVPVANLSSLAIVTGLLLRHYTQNIDTLERCAGIPEDKIVEAHGTFYTSHCLECRKEYPLEFVKERIFADQIPICTACPGVVKPDIVFFGESLPERFQQCLQEDFQQCDMLIIMGSSLEVQPFASLIDMVPEWCPRLLINREKAGVRSPLMRLWGLAGGGLQLDDGALRDVARLGDCDAGCLDLAGRLGWGDELRALVAREHERLELEKAGVPNIQGSPVAGHSGTPTEPKL